MSTENVAFAPEGIQGQKMETRQAQCVSSSVKQRFDSAREQFRKGIRETSAAVKDTTEDLRYEIKNHPLLAVAATALGGFAIGLGVGWLIEFRRRR